MKKTRLKTDPEKVKAWRSRSKPLKAKQSFKKQATRAKKRPAKRVKSKKPSMRLLKNKLWAECKRLVREKYGNGDGTFTCYTCGAYLDSPAKAQTGHFIPSSVCSAAMRYDLDNLRVQCYRCNINLSGNWIEYEARLKKEGIDTEALKQRNRDTIGKQYDSFWYTKKIEEYRTLSYTRR